MQLSVIVPIYNGETYLRNCIDSILEQSFRNFELILVNDGSIDATGEICDQYAQMDQRVMVCHKKNEGVTCARMTGLVNAKGNYIAFVDADDWLEEDFLKGLVERMRQERADMIVAGCVKEQSGRREIVLNNIPEGVYTGGELKQEIFPHMLYYQGFYQFGILPYLWNKLYKRELLLQCFEEVDTKIYDGEDVAIIFSYLLKINRIVVSSAAKYHYRLHGSSVTANKGRDYYRNCCHLYLYLYKTFKKTDWFEVLQPQLDQFMRKMIWQASPQSFPLLQEYVFPFDKVPKDAEIVLYGSGNVGRIYYQQIKKTGYCEITAWVDQNYRKSELQKLGVAAPEILKYGKYDYVVIAIADLGTVKNVRDVMGKMGVSMDRIIY